MTVPFSGRSSRSGSQETVEPFDEALGDFPVPLGRPERPGVGGQLVADAVEFGEGKRGITGLERLDDAEFALEISGVGANTDCEFDVVEQDCVHHPALFARQRERDQAGVGTFGSHDYYLISGIG